MNDAKTPKLEINGSRLFSPWLAGQKASLAFTTYQAGKLFLIGLKPDGGLSVFERTFDRCMGLGVRQGQLWMSSLYQLWRFENFLDPGALHEGYDGLFVPVAGHTTGDIDIHDIHAGEDGRPIFVATRSTASRHWPNAAASGPSGARPSSTGSQPRTVVT
jgi:uncharacterized protein (TIGR03032 family)